MFCYQCQETAKGTGCTVRGVCGKTGDVAVMQDLLVWLLKGISYYGVRARAQGIRDARADLFVAEALFATITNVNFDLQRFVELAHEAIELRDGLRAQLGEDENAPEMATWAPRTDDVEELVGKGMGVGILSDEDENEDLRSLRQLLILGLKGLAAYTDHAYVLEHSNDALLAFLQEGLLATTDDGLSADVLTGLVLKCGVNRYSG